MRGELSETSAADLCRRLADDGATGAVEIEHPHGRARIFFDDGRISWADSPAPRARLGDRLVHAALLTEEQLEQALTTQARTEPPPKLGTVLVDRGFVTQGVVRVFVQEQILDALFEVTGWGEGGFRFSPDATHDDELPVDLGVDDALVEVARRQQEWQQIRTTIPDLDAVPDFVAGASSATAALEPDEFAVLASVDGRRSIRELAVDLGYGEFEAARIVYGLVLLGIVHVDGGVATTIDIGAALDEALGSREATTSDAPSAPDRPQVRLHVDPDRWEPPTVRRREAGSDDGADPEEPFDEPEPVVLGDAGARGTLEAHGAVVDAPSGTDLDDAEFDRLLDELAGSPPERVAPPRETTPEVEPAPAAEAVRPDEATADEGVGDEPEAAGPVPAEAPAERVAPEPTSPPVRRRSDGADGDVSEFLRELSRLALDDDTDSGPPPEPDRSEGARSAADAAAKERSERPAPGDRDDRDDRKKRGLFGWGR